MSPRSILITGCNRGIGLELVKQYLKLVPPPTHLLATYRDPESSEELLQLAKDNTGLNALKVSKFQNDFMKTSFLPKYERKIVRVFALKCVGQKS